MVWQPRHRELKSAPYELFVVLVTLLSLLNLLLKFLTRSDSPLQDILVVMNWLLSFILFCDFAYRLVTAESRTGYVFKGFGWADLLASTPLPEAFVLRTFRLVRVTRLLRKKGVDAVADELGERRAGSTFLTLLYLGLLVLEFGSLQMLAIEQNAPGANITTSSDALWYTISTIATVGYGDRYPVTNAGRICGSVIIVVGVGIFGAFTGYLANIFLSPRQAPRRRAEGGGGTQAAAGPTADSGPSAD
ncbi:MAG: potassium channel family protein [Dermatophilaceae bacterium]